MAEQQAQISPMQQVVPILQATLGRQQSSSSRLVHYVEAPTETRFAADTNYIGYNSN